MPKYTIGIDFGTYSGRAVLVNVETGEETTTSSFEYNYGAMSNNLPDGKPIGKDWCLGHPQDYLDVLKYVVRDVTSDISIDDVIGIGIDYTSCSMLPVKADGTPLCFLPEFKNNPHSYVKLTKHTASEAQAKHMQNVARRRQEEWLEKYNSYISYEWIFPKILQIIEESPDIYIEADYFIECCDWIVWQLTGKQTRNSFSASYKALWDYEKGYPSSEYFKEVHPIMENVVKDKMDCPISTLGTKAGELTEEAAEMIGLKKGIAVAVAGVDIPACVPAVCATGKNKMISILGDSAVFLVLSPQAISIKGLTGPLKNSCFNDMFAYKLNQRCFGEAFNWYLHNHIPPSYHEDAKLEGRNIHSYVAQKMMRLAVGENGIISLEWLRGQQALLMSNDLSGAYIGLTPESKVEHIYRANIESFAFGTRKVIDAFAKDGIIIDELYGVGGVAERNPFIMQLYSDVLGIPVKISGSLQAPALGSAIMAAVVAGEENGGYSTIAAASEVMGKLKKVYTPIKENQDAYNELYTIYSKVYDFFGAPENSIMKDLKVIRAKAIQNK